MRCFLVSVVTAACGLLLGQQAAVPVSVQLQNGVFVVQGWTAPSAPPSGGWPKLLSVYAGSGSDVPALTGEYKVTGGVLSFKPRYPLGGGLRVRVVFRGVESFFEIPEAKLASTARVRQVYPSADVIPENQLKFYIEFSAPMSQGEAWKHIRLLKSDGSPVELPFLEIDQEMWDADARRLTVLFDPGRIKRGVKPLEDIGPAIESGHSYTLSIALEWRDATGAPLMEAYTKHFRVTEADRTPIAVSDWRIGAVRAGTRDALTIDFPEPLDAALAMRLIWVDGVRGEAKLGSEERQWSFVPEQPWSAGAAVLKVDTALEDLAGNKVGRPFEVDL
ncbi:MAG TPA: hypothetical protein VER03_08405, partial [Bryobacteraceae bacterium]|nr:hypothetical protein [Bryobacteraceae bacterium]